MIGDVLTSTILCQHLKIHFPNSQVHYVINEHTQAVVANNPYIDKVVFFKKTYRKNRLDFYRFLKSIQKERYDLVIDVYCKLESNLISYFSKAAIKISYRKWYSKYIYSHLFDYVDVETKLGYAIENRLLLLSPIIPLIERPNLAPRLYLQEDEVAKTKQLLRAKNIEISKPLIMIGVLGSGPNKSYPLEYLAAVINLITKNFDVTLLFNYMPNQLVKVHELLGHCSEKSLDSIRMDVSGSSLRSFISLLGQCQGYIGNEGGASNMAKALQIPNFSIFSPWISKKAWLTFAENTANQGVHLSDFQPEILAIPKKVRKKNALQLYASFKPELFEKQLLNFIGTEIFPNQ